MKTSKLHKSVSTVAIGMVVGLSAVFSILGVQSVMGQQPSLESFLVSNVTIPFGFWDDPLPPSSPDYTNHTFNELFYFGPCNAVWSGYAIYGPSWYYAGKASYPSGPVPYHNWGISYETVLKLNTTALRNKMIQTPEKFSQHRFIESRARAWRVLGGGYYVLIDDLKVDNPAWTNDGEHFANNFPSLFSRHSDDGSRFHVWDHVGIRETAFWAPYYADVAVSYANFIKLFIEDGVGEHANLALTYNTKVFAEYDWQCLWDINGQTQIGQGHITIPNWQSPPNGL